MTNDKQPQNDLLLCREAFEKWVKAKLMWEGHVMELKDDVKEMWFDIWQAAWNTRALNPNHIVDKHDMVQGQVSWDIAKPGADETAVTIRVGDKIHIIPAPFATALIARLQAQEKPVSHEELVKEIEILKDLAVSQDAHRICDRDKNINFKEQLQRSKKYIDGYIRIALSAPSSIEAPKDSWIRITNDYIPNGCYWVWCEDVPPQSHKMQLIRYRDGIWLTSYTPSYYMPLPQPPIKE